MKLSWARVGDTYQAEGDKGTWRIAKAETHFWLTIQPPFTRGMLNQGKFYDIARAFEYAQEREDGVKIVPLKIGPS